MLNAIKLQETDNVAVVIKDIQKGESVQYAASSEIIAKDDISQAHKIALVEIPVGAPVIRYGVILGYAKENLFQGSLVNEFMVELPEPPALKDLELKPMQSYAFSLPKNVRTHFEGYRVEGNEFAGTRNILGIHTTVQCVAGIVNIAAEKIRKELLPLYKNVDDVVALNHDYGCGVAIQAREAKYPIRALQNLTKNPNFGGELMIVGLGCEKFTPAALMQDTIPDDSLIILQEKNGFNEMLTSIVEMADRKLKKLNQRKRESLPLSMLKVGLQCGGSDAFSGITANPSAGYASDLLVASGATVMFSEVTEVRDGVHLLAERCRNTAVLEKLKNELAWYDAYLEAGEVDRSANPTPGNKKGGLSNIVEKAMGSIAKSGTAPIEDVIGSGEIPTKKGLLFAATSASDFVCGTMQAASGITIQVFMTGRGTPYGLAMLPVIKVCSQTDLKNMWNDIIDINAGTIITGEKTVQDVGLEIFNAIVDVASGRKKPWTEQYRIFNDLTVFNPAPIT